MASKKTDAGKKAATETPVPAENIPKDTGGNPIFIEEKVGDKIVRRPNPKYMATAEEEQGKYNPREIYEFVYIGPSDHKLPKIEKVEKDGKDHWIQTGGELWLGPGQRVKYLGWIGNHRESDFVLADDKAVTDDWLYPWSEDTIIERFKRVPPELFDSFVRAYLKLFGDRRLKVQDFYMTTSIKHRQEIEARQTGAF